MTAVDDFLDAWVDPGEILPWLPHEPYFVPERRAADVSDALRQSGFDVIHVDLSAAGTEDDLQLALTTALAFPEWAGTNWDAIHDVLRDRGENGPWKTAVVFTSAAHLLHANAHAFVRSVSTLRAISTYLASILDDQPSGQLELFYAGTWPQDPEPGDRI